MTRQSRDDRKRFRSLAEVDREFFPKAYREQMLDQTSPRQAGAKDAQDMISKIKEMRAKK